MAVDERRRVEPATLADEQLLGRIGLPGMFEEIYKRHVGRVTAFAERRCSTPHEVPDLVAAVWLEVIASAHSFDPKKGRALPWIFGVAANLTASNERRRARERDALQRLGRRPSLDERETDALVDRLDAAEPARAALAAIRDLPAGERLIAELVLVDGLEPSDAAKALGIRPATARMRLLRARSKLRHLVEPAPLTDQLPISEVSR